MNILILKVFKLFKIAHSDLILKPYPHGMADNFLGDDLFKRLSDEFPSDEWFFRNKEREFSGGRIDLVNGDPVFHEFLKQSTCWRQLFEKIKSQKFLEYIFSIFGSSVIDNDGKADPKVAKLVEYDPITPKRHLYQRVPSRILRDTRLRSFFRFIAGKFNPEEYYLEFSLAMSKPGYYVRPHTDDRHKFRPFYCFLIILKGWRADLIFWNSKPLKVSATANVTPQGMI